MDNLKVLSILVAKAWQACEGHIKPWCTAREQKERKTGVLFAFSVLFCPFSLAVEQCHPHPEWSPLFS